MRLGVYADLLFQRDEQSLSTDRSFVDFVTALAPRVDLVLFGRLDPVPGGSTYDVPEDRVRFVPLPYYRSVFAVGQLVRAIPGSCRAFNAELDRLDAVWLFGPAPLAVAFALVARRRKVPVFLGVRQDYVQYIGNRLPSRRWTWALAAARALDWSFRLIARRAPTATVGTDLARDYRGGSAPVLSFGVSLVRSADLTPLDVALAKRWDDAEVGLLSVGRLDPEKNPLLLLDVVSELRADDPRWRLTIAGDGPLLQTMREEIARRGFADAVELLGDVANGADLWQLYRSSHAFLHVSLTEGLPQVLYEACAAGLPVVATDVGGVGAALGHGERGLLVPPRDAQAAATALKRLADDEMLRRRLITAALEWAAQETLERQHSRLLAFFEENLSRGRSDGRGRGRGVA